MRTSEIKRDTNETKVAIRLDLDGRGEGDIYTGCGFLDHMLELFAHHGLFDLTVKCDGDVGVDYHHSVEDTGIALGMAFSEALGDKLGITRYGQQLLPMDEALVLCAVDISGRAQLGWDVTLPSQRVGDFDTELAKEFWLGFVRSFPCALHFRGLSGENTHHIIEAVFKGAGRALCQAVAIDARRAGQVSSTKGMI